MEAPAAGVPNHLPQQASVDGVVFHQQDANVFQIHALDYGPPRNEAFRPGSVSNSENSSTGSREPSVRATASTLPIELDFVVAGARTWIVDLENQLVIVLLRGRFDDLDAPTAAQHFQRRLQVGTRG